MIDLRSPVPDRFHRCRACALVQSHERLEDPLEVTRRDCRPIIDNGQDHSVRLFRHHHTDARRGMPFGVVDRLRTRGRPLRIGRDLGGFMRVRDGSPRSGRRNAISLATSAGSSIVTAAGRCIERERVSIRRSLVSSQSSHLDQRILGHLRPLGAVRVCQPDLELGADRRQRAAQLVRCRGGEESLAACRLFESIQHAIQRQAQLGDLIVTRAGVDASPASAASMRSTSARIESTGASARATTREINHAASATCSGRPMNSALRR